MVAASAPRARSAASASASSPADWKRSDASFARQRSTTASKAGDSDGVRSRGGTGVASTCCRMTSYQSSPSNGSTPVEAW